MYKVIIAGSRNFSDYTALLSKCDKLLSQKSEVEIVSGTANGADKLGERYANERGYLLKLFPAEWNVYGKGAGYLRNKEMAGYADALIAFWDGESRGTKHMIDIARKQGLEVRVIIFNKSLA
jgi:predicted Rossmann fold nucleotide-binding protein DprA/Smf involved in DNA uptake